MGEGSGLEIAPMSIGVGGVFTASDVTDKLNAGCGSGPGLYWIHRTEAQAW